MMMCYHNHAAKWPSCHSISCSFAHAIFLWTSTSPSLPFELISRQELSLSLHVVLVLVRVCVCDYMLYYNKYDGWAVKTKKFPWKVCFDSWSNQRHKLLTKTFTKNLNNCIRSSGRYHRWKQYIHIYKTTRNPVKYFDLSLPLPLL